MNKSTGGRDFICYCKTGDKPLIHFEEVKNVFVVESLQQGIDLIQVTCPNDGICLPPDE